MEKRRAQIWFAHTGAVLLFIIAAPLWFAARDKFDILSFTTSDPLLPLTNRQLLYLISGSELALSAFLLLAWHVNIRLAATAWLMFNLLIYQGCEYFWDQHNSLGGLATLADSLPVTTRIYDGTAWIVQSCLLFGSCTFLLRNWWVQRRQTGPLEPDGGKNLVNLQLRPGTPA